MSKNTYNTCQNTSCNKPIDPSIKHYKVQKYCNNKCQMEQQRNQRFTIMEQTNKYKKSYILNHYGNQCQKCGITEYNNEPIVMELEHIDGDSTNNTFDNLTLLCPNCHSQTPTYKNRNKGNGRHFRRLRYANGQSY